MSRGEARAYTRETGARARISIVLGVEGRNIKGAIEAHGIGSVGAWVDELDICTLIESGIGDTSLPLGLDNELLSDLEAESREIWSGFAMMTSVGSSS